MSKWFLDTGARLAMARLVGCVAIFVQVAVATASSGVYQSERQIPVARQVDVVVVGGSVGAVAAAIEASENGAAVLLVAPRTYLGDDLCGSLVLWLEEGEQPRGELARALFPSGRTATPLHVKRVLEAALLDKEVDFLLASYATDMLYDCDGQPAGVVIANRAGRQAVISKVIIDATGTGAVARLAGAEFREAAPGPQRCRRVVLGGEQSERATPVRTIRAGVAVRGSEQSYYVYEADMPCSTKDFGQFAEAEQQMRDLTYREGQLRASERIEVVPEAIQGRCLLSTWRSSSAAEVGHFQPAGIDRLFVIGTASDVPRDAADQLTRPDAQESIGRIVGRAAAKQCAGLDDPTGVRVAPRDLDTVRQGGDVLEKLTGLRPVEVAEQTVPSAATAVPVLADVDIVVVGGGTSGACAAISAARRGAKVLVIEYQEGLGGVGTLGLIGKPYHGLDRGFTAEVPFPDDSHHVEYKMEWFRRQIRDAGGRIWFGVAGCGAYVEDDRVRGALAATPLGRGAVLARVVIDATGNADIAVAAGADSMYGGDLDRIALQGTGLPKRPLTASYVNTDYLLVDESDMLDVWRAFVGTRLSGETTDFDMAPFIQTRERRRVVGDHVLTYLDQIAGRTYPDSIVLSGSDYDSHGYPSEPYFALIPHTEKTLKANHPAPGGTCYTPYRCLLPRGIDGMLVTGLGISMTRDASAMVRMQKDMHNQGYAAGLAAAMAVESNCTPREIDVDRLQQYLVDIGNLPESVLTDEDSFPLSEDAVRDAASTFVNTKETRAARCKSLAIVLSHAQAAKPILLRAYRDSAGPARLDYAKVLGFLGEREGADHLIAALAEIKGWDPKILQGNMAEYAHLPTPVDALILALGYGGDPGALAAILPWVDRLDADVTLSHHLAVAIALESLADPAAAEPLARLLKQSGMGGHAMTSLEPLYNRDRDRRRRTGPLREIELARALYRCGDCEGVGEGVLDQYRDDLRGLFARYAEAVLAAGPNP